MYEAISGLWPKIESIFSEESTLAVRSQAVTSLIKLNEAVRKPLIYGFGPRRHPLGLWRHPQPTFGVADATH
jgi:hypothetical protein